MLVFPSPSHTIAWPRYSRNRFINVKRNEYQYFTFELLFYRKWLHGEKHWQKIITWVLCVLYFFSLSQGQVIPLPRKLLEWSSSLTRWIQNTKQEIIHVLPTRLNANWLSIIYIWLCGYIVCNDNGCLFSFILHFKGQSISAT